MTNQSKKCFMLMSKQQRVDSNTTAPKKKQNISGVIMLKFPWQQKVS